MVENKERLIDATKRLLASGTSDEEAKKSMTDIGVSDDEAQSIVDEAKKSKSAKKPIFDKPEQITEPKGTKEVKQSTSDFWDSSSGGFFHAKTTTTSKPSTGFSLMKTSDDEISEEEKKGKKKSIYAFKKVVFRETVPTMVSDFDKLIDRGGLKKGDTILISGGAGTGKTTFGMQFVYMGAKHLGQKGVYLTLEETVDKIKENMMENFGWDIDELEKKGLIAIIKIDPLTIARAVEATLTNGTGKWLMAGRQDKRHS